ncbi:MAG: DUF2064 domain-containing protein [Acidobacteriota bacterium]
MTPEIPRATLLVFTLGADRDAVRRPVLPPRLRDEEVAARRAWLDGVLEAGRRTHCRLEVSAPTNLDLPQDVFRAPQEGGTFGQRLARAIGRAGGHTDGPLVVVGADSPGFSARHIRQALCLLRADPKRVVLGPAADGGVYLIATARPIPGLAENVVWCQSHTLRSLKSILKNQGREVVELEALADIDDVPAFIRWLRSAESAWRGLIGHLRARLAATLRPGRPRRLGSPRDSQASPLLARGPPAVA